MNEPAESINDADVEHDIREKIVFILNVYPEISPTMLQAGIGPQLSPKKWRPVLEDLIAEGVIEQHTETLQSPTGRHNSYVILSLAIDYRTR